MSFCDCIYSSTLYSHQEGNRSINKQEKRGVRMPIETLLPTGQLFISCSLYMIDLHVIHLSSMLVFIFTKEKFASDKFICFCIGKKRDIENRQQLNTFTNVYTVSRLIFHWNCYFISFGTIPLIEMVLFEKKNPPRQKHIQNAHRSTNTKRKKRKQRLLFSKYKTDLFFLFKQNVKERERERVTTSKDTQLQ